MSPIRGSREDLFQASQRDEHPAFLRRLAKDMSVANLLECSEDGESQSPDSPSPTQRARQGSCTLAAQLSRFSCSYVAGDTVTMSFKRWCHHLITELLSYDEPSSSAVAHRLYEKDSVETCSPAPSSLSRVRSFSLAVADQSRSVVLDGAMEAESRENARHKVPSVSDIEALVDKL